MMPRRKDLSIMNHAPQNSNPRQTCPKSTFNKGASISSIITEDSISSSFSQDYILSSAPTVISRTATMDSNGKTSHCSASSTTTSPTTKKDLDTESTTKIEHEEWDDRKDHQRLNSNRTKEIQKGINDTTTSSTQSNTNKIVEEGHDTGAKGSTNVSEAQSKITLESSSLSSSSSNVQNMKSKSLYESINMMQSNCLKEIHTRMMMNHSKPEDSSVALIMQGFNRAAPIHKKNNNDRPGMPPYNNQDEKMMQNNETDGGRSMASLPSLPAKNHYEHPLVNRSHTNSPHNFYQHDFTSSNKTNPRSSPMRPPMSSNDDKLPLPPPPSSASERALLLCEQYLHQWRHERNNDNGNYGNGSNNQVVSNKIQRQQQYHEFQNELNMKMKQQHANSTNECSNGGGGATNSAANVILGTKTSQRKCPSPSMSCHPQQKERQHYDQQRYYHNYDGENKNFECDRAYLESLPMDHFNNPNRPSYFKKLFPPSQQQQHLSSSHPLTHRKSPLLPPPPQIQTSSSSSATPSASASAFPITQDTNAALHALSMFEAEVEKQYQKCHRMQLEVEQEKQKYLKELEIARRKRVQIAFEIAASNVCKDEIVDNCGGGGDDNYDGRYGGERKHGDYSNGGMCSSEGIEDGLLMLRRHSMGTNARRGSETGMGAAISYCNEDDRNPSIPNVSQFFKTDHDNNRNAANLMCHPLSKVHPTSQQLTLKQQQLNESQKQAERACKRTQSNESTTEDPGLPKKPAAVSNRQTSSALDALAMACAAEKTLIGESKPTTTASKLHSRVPQRHGDDQDYSPRCIVEENGINLLNERKGSSDGNNHDDDADCESSDAKACKTKNRTIRTVERLRSNNLIQNSERTKEKDDPEKPQASASSSRILLIEEVAPLNPKDDDLAAHHFRNHGSWSPRVTINDVLCGRGGLTNNHGGNVFFRGLVRSKQEAYLFASKRDKAYVAHGIVDVIRSLKPPGRFLKKNKNNIWVEIGNKKAREKTSQALREKAPELMVMLQKDGTNSELENHSQYLPIVENDHAPPPEKRRRKSTQGPSGVDQRQTTKKGKQNKLMNPDQGGTIEGFQMYESVHECGNNNVSTSLKRKHQLV